MGRRDRIHGSEIRRRASQGCLSLLVSPPSSQSPLSLQVRVSCRAVELLGRLQAEEEVNALVGTENRFLWRPEFAAYMIEGTPGVPYGGSLVLPSCA